LQVLSGSGATNYRFSISWSRLFPGGKMDVNEQANLEAVNHYNDVIDNLIDRGVTPVVTLYHFDLPQVIQDQGGRSQEKRSPFCAICIFLLLVI